MIITESFWKKEWLMPAPIQEFYFHETRKWRIDHAWADVKLAVEKEGGAWISGRHNRGKGFIADMEKYNMLTENGWHLLRYEPKKFDYDQIARCYHNLKSEGL